MKLKFPAFAALCAVVLLSALLAGCPNPGAPGGKGGSLTITINNNINARTLLPPIDMNAASYTVSGSGPSGQSFSQSTSGLPMTINNLAFGSWAVTVNALNATGTVIGQGQGNATVNTGETTTLTVSVTPLAGTGSLNLTVNWTASQVQSPSIQASLTPLGPSSMSFTIQGAQATYTNSTIPVGYQTLTLQLLDNNIPVIGAVEVVRIVAGQTTSGTYTFTNVNQPGGTIVVNITPALANPIPLSISGVGSTLTEGASMTATASVGDGTQNVTYVWYLNGVWQPTAAGSSYTFGSNLGLGYYRLDVTAFTTDGTRAGSATASFQVVPMVNEGFEEYPAGSYPSAGGWYNLWSGISAAVVSGIAHSGNQSFYLQGQPNWVRADGINLPLSGVNVITYSVAVMVPSGSAAGARVGFFLYTSSNTSIDFNSVDFSPGAQITATGQVTQGTGIICQPNTWYVVKVQLDYSAGIMNVWVNGQEMIWNLPASSKQKSSIFFLGTDWLGSASGTMSAYFDDIVIY